MSAPPMYLSRARLRRDVPAAALRAVLAPEGAAERAATTHRLVWTLFADSPERERDFLWREAEPGSFYCLSSRPPVDRHGLFDVDPPKAFAPALSAGDRLGFALRVNATVARGGRPRTDGQSGVRGKPCDIVMDALCRAPELSRPEARQRLLVPVAHDWLARQGSKHGFCLPPLPQPHTVEDSDDVDDGPFRVTGYRVLAIDRGRKARPLRAGVLDLEGVLEVSDPARFVEAVRHGFGRAKAFGCGLMLIRRV
ncbi:MAG TPA: type I-E CRISPR-associated protein Cas6/Cse3/CasE [Gemmatimonadaceae bacterium]|nr:type I-E CRISPR-associated protein Cas6/Cse3/CasE [Gemmatimonadaceae bacterium]